MAILRYSNGWCKSLGASHSLWEVRGRKFEAYKYLRFLSGKLPFAKNE